MQSKKGLPNSLERQLIRLNQPMLQIIEASMIEKISIPKKTLRRILQGFDSQTNAYTFRFLRKRALSAPKSKFSDMTGFECYVNEIGLNSEDHSHHTILGMEILIATLNDWTTRNQGLVLRGIISADPEFTYLTFHVVRPNETYLDDDLDSYDQPILMCDSGSSINNLFDFKKECIRTTLNSRAHGSQIPIGGKNQSVAMDVHQMTAEPVRVECTRISTREIPTSPSEI